MNEVLARTIDRHCNNFNPYVTNGTAKDILKTIPDYLDIIFRSAIKSLDPSIELIYEGYRKIAPDEEFKTYVTGELSKSSGKSLYDLSTSDFYLIEYLFKYKDETVRRPLYLPFAERGNIIKISGKPYSFIPILSDRVISPSFNQIFIRLLKDKITFESKCKRFILNGLDLNANIIHTKIIKIQKSKITSDNAYLTPVSLYLLAKYGFKEVVRKYCKCTEEQMFITDQNVDHLRDKYNVYESTKIKPKEYKNPGYVGHDFKILIDKSLELKGFRENFICGMIYILDLYCDEDHKRDTMDLITNNRVKDELFHWRLILGDIAYSSSFSIMRIVEDMNEHFKSLDNYLDDLSRNKLHDININVVDFYDLLAHILEIYNTVSAHSKEYNSDIKNRYIDLLYYILYDIIVGFNTVILNLNKRVGKKKDGLSTKEINKIMTNCLGSKKIFQLVKSDVQNLAIQQVDLTSDIYYPRITAILDDQSRGNGVRRGSKVDFPEATKTLNGYDMYLGSLLFLNKKAPSPRFRTNLYVQYDIYTGKLHIPDNVEKTVTKLNTILRGKFVNTKAVVFDNTDDITKL